MKGPEPFSFKFSLLGGSCVRMQVEQLSINTLYRLDCLGLHCCEEKKKIIYQISWWKAHVTCIREPELVVQRWRRMTIISWSLFLVYSRGLNWQMLQSIYHIHRLVSVSIITLAWQIKLSAQLPLFISVSGEYIIFVDSKFEFGMTKPELRYVLLSSDGAQGSPHLQKTGRLDFSLRELNMREKWRHNEDFQQLHRDVFPQKCVVSSYHLKKKLHFKCAFANILLISFIFYFKFMFCTCIIVVDLIFVDFRFYLVCIEICKIVTWKCEFPPFVSIKMPPCLKLNK